MTSQSLIEVQRQTENGLGIFPMPAADYHADKAAVSKSMLSDFRDSHREYFHKHVALDMPSSKSSKRMDIGTLAHVALLEPDRLDQSYAIFPNSVLGKDGRESTNAAADFRDEHEADGRVVLKAHEFEVVKAMRDSVLLKVGHWLRVDRRIEHAVYWTDPATGLKCRCRPDWLIEGGDTAFIFDFKTTDDARPQAFRKVAENFDYGLQHAHYSDGVHAALGRRIDTEFYFVVVQTCFPWTCVIYELSSRSAIDAEHLRIKLLTELAACQRHNDWSDPWEHDIRPLDLRPFAFE